MVTLRKIPLIAISMGDPAGIGPEVILKAAARLARRRGAPMLAVIGDIGAMRETACRLGAEVPEPYEGSVGDKPLKHGNGLAVISAGKLSRDARRPAHPTAEGADAAYRYVVAGARLALVTVHMGLAKVPRMLTCDSVFHTIRLLAEHLRGQLGIARPRIVVLGFNPHAGENGLFGNEERKVIAPAIQRARRNA